MPARPHYFQTPAIAASPTDGNETVIAALGGVTVEYPGQTIKFSAAVAITPGADCTGVGLRIRRDNLAGLTVGHEWNIGVGTEELASGVVANIAANDTPGDVNNATYVLTAHCYSASAPSTVTSSSVTARVD